MEDINSKLNSDNPITSSQIVSKLIQNIKTKDEDILELPDFKVLKETCISGNSSASLVAAEGILNIVRAGDQLLIKSVITDLVSVITTTKYSPNIAFLINNLLLTDLHKEVVKSNSYHSNFNLRLPQHPLLIMLTEDPTCWSSIYREIVYTYKTGDKRMISHYNELYKPLFLYTFCAPHGDHILAFQQKLWTFVVQIEATYGTNCINYILSWMEFANKETLQINSDFLIELFNMNRHKQMMDPNVLLLWQTTLLYQLIENNFDPRDMILSIFNSLDNVDVVILNPILLILAKCISRCSAVHLLYLLKLCNGVISRTKYDVITCNIVKSALLQWMTNASDLILDATLYANNIFSYLEKENTNDRSKGFSVLKKNSHQLLTVNIEAYFFIELYALLEFWKTENDILRWVVKVEKAPVFFIAKIVDFLVGLFLSQFEDKMITTKLFHLLMKCVDCDKTLASRILTVLLFKLTSVVDSNLHYLLLKAIPTMAITRNNFQKVVNTILALNKGRDTLKSFSTSLMLDLWKIDNKCYPYLESFLIESYSGQGDRWEFYVTIAHTLKELCAMKPELYGKEIVAHLSKILNECNNADGAVPSALAIDGITLLCKSEIIDAVTTWATLSPIFQAENRIPVIQSLCALISEIPNLSYSEAYPQLIEEVVAKLWEYLMFNPNDEVWTASLTALTHFRVEQIVAGMPEEFCGEESVNIRKSGQLVPGQCWIHFLKNCSESKLNIVGNFLIKLISREIMSYLKFVYQVKGTREPVDYSYLPLNSVVRGLSTFIKAKVVKWNNSIHKEVYLQCLRIFSQEYNKPLPPLDWCFLQELFHEPEAKEFCVDIAAHQVVLSGTARRFIVNYIEAVSKEHKEQDILLIYRNLKYLANSVQPFTLKPFFEITMYRAVELFMNGQESFLNAVTTYIKQTLENPNIQEANKAVIAQIINDICNDLNDSSKLFEKLLECIILFPSKCVDDISSPKCVKEVREQWFKKAVKIRCSIAMNSDTTPLNVLNDLMESGSTFTKLQPFIFEQFAAVFTTHKDNTGCVLWLLELIGQIQAMTAEKSDQREVFFLCDIFILASIVFSGYSVFLKDLSYCEDLYNIFPRAIATLLDVDHWSICTTQALEWFYYMSTQTQFSKKYNNMYVECLQSLRHEPEFRKNMKWTKYLNVECSFS